MAVVMAVVTPASVERQLIGGRLTAGTKPESCRVASAQAHTWCIDGEEKKFA